MSSHIRRDVLSYRYLKRNLLAATLVVGMTALIAVVVKYGEALDSKADYKAESAYEIAYMGASMMDENSIAVVMDTIHNDSAQVVAKENDVLAEPEQPSEFDGRFIAKITDTLNIRESASVDAAIVGKMFDGTVGEILGEEGEWTKISSGTVVGYVKTEFILTGKEAEDYAVSYKKLIGTITEETVRLRSDMSTESDVLGLVAQGTKFDVLSDEDEWVKVLTLSGQEGYIASDYISVEETYSVALSISEYDAIYNKPEETTQSETTEESNTEGQSQSTSSSESTEPEKPATEQKPAEQKPSQETSTVDSADYSDAYLLACLVSMEAGGESYEGQLAVANVVLNRVRSGYWGSSISSVIYAPNQFPCATGSVMQNYLQNGPLPTAQQAANDALAGNNNIGSFMSFLNVNYIDTSSLSDYKVIGNHCFY